ncbi:hypothetical protein ES703_107081 [subsurface metagenome]
MDWLSIISLIGGFIMFGVGIYLTFKARTEPYRQTLYSKQLDGYVEIVNALIDVYKTAHGVFFAKGLKLGKEAESELSSIVMNKYSAFDHKHKKWVVVLPKEMNVLFANFRKDLEKILNLPFKNNPGKLFRDVYIEIIAKTRKAIGTEPLSEETLKLITKVPREEKPKLD